MMEILIKRFDPRVKSIFLVVFVTVFFLKISLPLLLAYLFLMALLASMFFGIKSLKAPVLGIAPLLVLILILTPLFNRNGTGLLVIGSIPIVTWNGLSLGFRLAIRFCGITLVFFLFYISTSQSDTILALRWFGMPFKLALTVTISLRYIPYLTGVYGDIRNAHRLRGIYFGERGRKGKTKIFSILVSLMIYAIKRIPTLAMSLECRGVGREGRRTSYLKLKSPEKMLVDLLILILFFAMVFSPLIFL